MKEIFVEFENTNQLYRAYMPFVNNGGLFIATNIEANLGDSVTISLRLPDELEATKFESVVVWLNPVGVQGARPVGVGVQLPANNIKIKTLIETSLSRKLNGIEMTATM